MDTKKNKRKRENKSCLSVKTVKPVIFGKKSRIFVVIGALFVAGLTSFAFLYGNHVSEKKSHIVNVQSQANTLPQIFLSQKEKSSFAKLTDVKVETILIPKSELDEPRNLARLNLMCAKGLPGSENMDIEECIKILEDWVKAIKSETEKYSHKFKENPQDYYNSEAYFKVLIMITVLQQDFGVKYNMDKVPKERTEEELNRPFANDSRDVFIHGLLTGKHEGTCASMPVLYLIVGRMLGYPLKLVSTKNHLFIRWEDDKERVNLEATGPGLSIFSDEYYKHWPLPFNEAEEKSNYFLKSMSHQDEYATFLLNRAQVFGAMGNQVRVRELYEKILEIQPNHSSIKRCLGNRDMRKLLDKQKKNSRLDVIRKQSVQRATIAINQISLGKAKQQTAIQQKYVELIPKNPEQAHQWKIEEQNHLQTINRMQISELKNWQSQAISDNGAEITQTQIDLLMGKIVEIPRPVPLPKQYVEQQNHQRAKKLQKEMPHLSFKKAFAMIETQDEDFRRKCEIQWVNYCIKQARWLRGVADEKEHLVKKGFDKNKFISEKDIIANMRANQ